MNHANNHLRRALLASLTALALLTPSAGQPAKAAAGFPGTSPACNIDKGEFEADLIAYIGPIVGGALAGIAAFTLPDGIGLAWVNPDYPMQTETGVVEDKSDYSTKDFPWDHNSHDVSFDVRPDASSQFLLADANVNDQNGLMENEWESSQFPAWAWPNIGDRVWVNGNWVLDCNNELGSDHYASEIHPARAIATMREEVHTLPGSGTTPVLVKGTDLYIHGNGGYADTILECGVNIITLAEKLDPHCTPHPSIAQNYDFEIPIGPAPFPGAVPAYSFEDGPGNTLTQDPTLTFEDASTLNGAPAYKVHVPLAGSGATDDDVYARKIYTGWLAPPSDLRHYQLELVKGIIHHDGDPVPDEGCDCTQFTMSVNRAPNNEWSGLNGYDHPTDQDSDFCPGDNTLDDWRDCGNGQLNFSGPIFDFYTADGDNSVNIHFKGLTHECGDDAFGDPHSFAINGVEYAGCWLESQVLDHGPDDVNLGTVDYVFDPGTLTDGDHRLDGINYSMVVRVAGIPLDQENSADLGVKKSCTPAEVTAPSPFTCRIEVTNAGPGLPHDVKVTSSLTAPTANHTITNAMLSWENVAAPPAPVPCTISGNNVTCNLVTVPLGGAKGVITYQVPSTDGGTFTDNAAVTSGSTDSNSANDSATASAHVSVPTLSLLSPSVDPSQIGQAVTYTAAVTSGVGTSTPTGGTVAFYDYGLTIAGCASVPLSSGSATCAATYSSAGNHHLTASYSGSTDFLPSTSPPLGQTVTKCSKVAGCDLSGADLSNAPEAGVNFHGASLKVAQLVGTNFKGAILSGTNLSGANLSGANLAGADLTGANLQGANLTGANLAGAVTTGANFTGVIWSNTTCPDGTNSTINGGTCTGHL